MPYTTHLLLPLVDQSQAQKEVTVNEALSRIDAILNTGAVDKDAATPPLTPLEGEVYVVASSATGDWAGKDGQIAYYNSGWKFLEPQEGMSLWVNDENLFYVFDGADWRAQQFRAPGKTSLYIDARQWESGVSNPAGALTVTALTAGNPALPRRSFANSVKTHLQYAFKLPKSWNRGAVTYRVFFFTQSTAITTVRWGLQGVAVSHHDTLDTAFGSAAEVTSTLVGASNDLVVTAESGALAVAGTPADGDLLVLQLYRDGANDTFAGSAYFLGLELFYTTDAANDA